MLGKATVFYVITMISGSALASDSHQMSTAKKEGAKSTTSNYAEIDGVAPDVAMSWLKNGNARYVKKNWRGSDGKTQKDRDRLAKGQHPHTILLSCADSRVPPELLFDQALGEIFVVRVAGEALDSSVLASIEYAVEHLGTRNIVVMGHTSCGAVKAALGAKEGESTGSPHIDALVRDIKPRLGSRSVASTGDLSEEATINAKGIAGDLTARSAILKKALASGKIKITSGLYHIDTGLVDFF